VFVNLLMRPGIKRMLDKTFRRCWLQPTKLILEKGRNHA